MWLVVVASGVVLFAWSFVRAIADPALAPAVFLFGIAGAIAESFGVPMPGSRPGHRLEVAVSSAVYVAGLILFPLHWAILLVCFSTLLAQIPTRRVAWFKTAYNVGQFCLAVGAASSLWALAGPGRQITDAVNIPFLLAAPIVYFVVNTTLVTAIISLASGMPVRVTWWRTHRHVLPAWLGMIFTGVLVAGLWSTVPWMIVFAAAGLAGVYYALRNTASLETQTIEALLGLADILDARDPYTHGHSLRVGEYAEQLALAVGSSGDRAYVIHLSGRLHDIGKCAIRNEVLLKPGPLDQDERNHMCQHAAIGGSMLGNFALFQECARYVRGHHERWDGAGYPDRLAGEEIPFGARVIAVADAYDAMTTTRPYRTALDHAEAIRRLREGAGTQWDARLVGAFIRMMDDGSRARVAARMVPAHAAIVAA